MEVKASLNNLKISPRKVRLAVGLARKMETNKALDQLQHSQKKSAKELMKLINSAVANAVNNYELDKNNLYIKEIRVDQGQVLKRWMPRARGRATPIRKNMSSVKIVLDEIVLSGKQDAKKQKLEAPVMLGAKPKIDAGVEITDEKKTSKTESAISEKGKKIIDPRSEGRHGHAKIEGGSSKGFVNRIFRRKSG